MLASDSRPQPLITDLPVEDRVSALLSAASVLGKFDDFSVEHADTNEGKALSKLCKKISHPLRQALKKQGCLKPGSRKRLHILFLDGRNAYVGVGMAANSSPWAMGVPRLKMPGAAPSRATLKLDEAIM